MKYFKTILITLLIITGIYTVPVKANSANVTCTLDKGKYYVAKGQKLDIVMTIDSEEDLDVSSPTYWGYIAYLQSGEWQQIAGFQAYGGKIDYRLSIDLSSCDLKLNKEYLCSAAVFPYDNFVEGASLCDFTFFLQLLPESFVVNLDTDGGSCESQSVNVIYGKKYGKLPTPVKDGYEFLGWYTSTSEDSAVDESTIVTKTYNHTLYAKWLAVSSARPMSYCTVDALSDAVYTGDVIEPEPIVSYKGEQLVKGRDYTLSYSNNIDAGTANVTVKGINKYAGNISTKFTIQPRNISEAKMTLKPANLGYTGNNQYPKVTIKYGTKELKSGTDYSVQYPDESSGLGTYSLTVKGKGNFKGNLSKSYKIIEQSINGAEVTLSSTRYSYNGSAKKPSPTVVLNGVKLIQNTDYKIAYSDNVNAGTAKITITGINNYKDSIDADFAIEKATPTITAENKNVIINNSKDLEATTSSGGLMTYKSSNTKIVEVNSEGQVKGKAYGVSTITIESAATNNYNAVSQKVNVKVVPKTMSVKTLTSPKSKTIKITWKKDSTVTGYQIGFSTSSERSKLSYKNVPSYKTTSKTVTGFNSKKKYYFWIRAYKTINGTKYYSSWSESKSVKVK